MAHRRVIVLEFHLLALNSRIQRLDDSEITRNGIDLKLMLDS